VLPNVTLTLTDTSTKAVKETHSEADGGFVFANILAGTYQLTGAMNGFQTAVLNGVVVDSGRTLDLTVELKVGTATERVEVSTAAVQLETTSNEVGSTINSKMISTLPYTSRDALNFALLIPGAQSASGGSTFDGLPNASLNISIDGMNSNSQRFKSGGTSFYSFGSFRLDAVEEVTVSTAGLGAESGGGGAMDIRFTTKRGTDRYHFHLLEQFYNEDLNANSYFNKLTKSATNLFVHRGKSRTQDYAGNVGGPLAPFIPSLKNKLFFFLNFEDVPGYGGTTSTVTVLTPNTYTGLFTYLGTDGQNHSVNLLTAVAASGCQPNCTSTIDPTISGVLGQIQATQVHSIGYLPINGQPYWQTMQYGQPTYNGNIYPTARIDWIINSKVAWHGTWNDHRYIVTGTPNYPDGPFPSTNGYLLNSPVTSNTFDFTITPHLLNSIAVGTQGNMEYFYSPSDVHQWAQYGNRNLSLWPVVSGQPTINPLVPNNTPWKRNNPVWQVNDNGTWIKDKHTITFGANFLRTSFYEQSYGNAGITSLSFGIATNDAVNNVLSQTSGVLPFINTSSTTDITNARNLYAMLTGRISSYYTSYNVDEKTHGYAQFAPLMQRFALNTLGTYLQDSWRVTSNLTVNFGLHWEFDGPIHNTNGIDSWPTNLYGPSNANFQPGVLNASFNPVVNVQGTVYQRDNVTPAPTFGFAWSPNGGEGLLGRFLGHAKSVIGGSYGISYYNEGLNAISNLQCCNVGTSQSADASAAIGANPGAYNLTTAAPPMVYNPTSFTQQSSLMGFPTNGGTTIYYANPDLKSPYVQSWNLRFQREISRGTVLDIRYVGNKGTHLWHYQNMNETNVFENGFLQEFQNAQSNLAIANGISVAQLTSLPAPTLSVNNFSNTGKAGQVALPILAAAFGANGTQTALSTSSGFGSSTYIQYLEQGNVGTFASSLASTSTGTTYCRMVGSNFTPCANQGYTTKTAYAMNFFRPNPYANSIYYQNDDGNTNYNALQIELRKSLAHGLMVDAHYTLSHTLGTFNNSSDQTASYTYRTLRNGHLDYGPLNFDHRHAMVIYFQYDLPFGKGKWVNVDNKILNAIVGGWTIGDQTNVVSGGPVLLSCARMTFNATADGGCVLGSGLNIQQLLQRTATNASYTYAIGNSTYAAGTVIQAGQYDHFCNCFHTNVSDIQQANGTVVPADFQPYDQAGALGPRIYYTGKTAYTLNASVTKVFQIKERIRLRLYAEASNFLNHPFFSQGSISVTSTSFGNITSASGNRTMFLRGVLDF
jgi:hypothetical protein